MIDWIRCSRCGDMVDAREVHGGACHECRSRILTRLPGRCWIIFSAVPGLVHLVTVVFLSLGWIGSAEMKPAPPVMRDFACVCRDDHGTIRPPTIPELSASVTGVESDAPVDAGPTAPR